MSRKKLIGELLGKYVLLNSSCFSSFFPLVVSEFPLSYTCCFALGQAASKMSAVYLCYYCIYKAKNKENIYSCCSASRKQTVIFCTVLWLYAFFSAIEFFRTAKHQANTFTMPLCLLLADVEKTCIRGAGIFLAWLLVCLSVAW